MAAATPNPSTDLVAPGRPIVEQAGRVADLIASLSITNDVTYTNAATELTAIKATAKDVEAARKKILEPIDASRKAVQDFFKPALDRLAAAESQLKTKMLQYRNAREQEARAEQARLEAARREEVERLRREEAWSRAMGDEGEADAHSLAATVVEGTVEVVEVAPPKVEGIGTRTTYNFEVLDLRMLAAAWVEGKLPDGFVEANDKALRAYAVATKGKGNLPGVRMWADAIVTAAAR